MNIKGRCRGNGAQLGQYLSNTKDNFRAECLATYGASTSDPRRALLEMSLTSELSSRTDDGLYHMQLSPRAHEAADMTWEQKLRSVEITAEKMGLEGHKWSLWEHEKEDGRIHMHLVFERYNHDTGRMWNDNLNYKKHLEAARQMEKEFGWEITHERKNHLDGDVKDIISQLYFESENGQGFVKAMAKAGFEITQGMDRRPYQIVDQYGIVHDLTRQIAGARQGDISKYLNDIRHELRPTARASQDRRLAYERTQSDLDHSDNFHELSDSQDLAKAMIDKVKQQFKEDKEQPKTFGYGFSFEQSLQSPLPSSHDPSPKIQSDKNHELSDSQHLAEAMLKQVRAGKEASNDNDPLKQFRQNNQEDLLAKFRSQKSEKIRANERTRERDGPE